MTRNGPRITATFPLPFAPAVDVGPYVRMTNDLMAQAGRLWVDLWFRNLNLATEAFWRDVRTRGDAT